MIIDKKRFLQMIINRERFSQMNIDKKNSRKKEKILTNDHKRLTQLKISACK